MKKLTIPEKITRLLAQRGGWVPSYDLAKVDTDWGWIGTSGSRRARELAEAGEIEVRHTGKYAEYRYKPKTYYKYVPEELDNGNVRLKKIAYEM